jgi:hypothetical protein
VCEVLVMKPTTGLFPSDTSVSAGWSTNSNGRILDRSINYNRTIKLPLLLEITCCFY